MISIFVSSPLYMKISGTIFPLNQSEACSIK